MKRFLLALLITPAALGATYNVALPGGGVLTINGVAFANPAITNSASVVWGVDGAGFLYATATGTNSSIIYVEGSAVAGPNFGVSTEVDPVVTAATNITFSLVNSSITTNKIDATFYGLLTATSGGGLGTNIFVNNVLLQPAKLTNSATVTWATNSAGDIEATSIAAGTGDVVGPASSTADTLAIYHSTTGKLLTNAPAIAATNVQTITAAVAAYEPLNANKYQATNAALTALAADPSLYQSTNGSLTTLASEGSTGSGAFVRADSPTLTGTWAFDSISTGTLTVTNPFPARGITNATASRFAVFGADYRLTNDVAETGTGAPVRANSPALITPTLGVASATSVAIGATNVVSELALKAPLASPALASPTLNDTVTFEQTVLAAHSSVTNFVADPTVSPYQTINADLASSFVTVGFLHATNVAAGRQTTVLVFAGTNAAVTVSLAAQFAMNTNSVALTTGQVLPVSFYGYGSSPTNVVATLGTIYTR